MLIYFSENNNLFKKYLLNLNGSSVVVAQAHSHAQLSSRSFVLLHA